MLELQITQPDTPLAFRMEKCLSSTGLKIRKNISIVHIIGGAYVHCMNNHSAKFEYKGMRTVEDTEYTTQTQSKHFEQKHV